MRLCHLHCFFNDLYTLALEDIGEARIVLQRRMVEFGNSLIVLPIPIVKLGRDNAAGLKLLVQANPIEKFQRGWMIAASARHLIEEIVIRHRLAQHDGNVFVSERQRQAEPDRSCTYYDDWNR